MMPCRFILAALLATVGKGLSKQGRDDPVDFELLRSHVEKSKVFQDKIVAMCPGLEDVCKDKASDKLLCELLQRSKPKVAAKYCGETGTSFVQHLGDNKTMPAIADVKARIFR